MGAGGGAGTQTWSEEGEPVKPQCWGRDPGNHAKPFLLSLSSPQVLAAYVDAVSLSATGFYK